MLTNNFSLRIDIAPFPMSLFTQERMRKGHKSSFHAAFQPISNDESLGKTKFVVEDVSHLLHKVVWTKNSSFELIAARLGCKIFRGKVP